jgi:predicted O-methyltransferase YrrM
MEVLTASQQVTKEKTALPARPLRAFMAQVVREYRDKVAERLLRRELRKPWMKYREIGVLEDLLRSLKPKRVLEWGAGYGTLHFARFLPEDSLWVALEHDPAWAARIREMTVDPRVRIHTVLPDAADWKERDRDGTYEDFKAYVDFAERYAPYDFILVDGRARESCLERAHDLLSPHGVVALHDANRSFRRAPGGQFPSEAEFRDYRRWAGGLWLGSKGGSLADVLDLGRHGRIWRMYNSLGKGFHL